MDWFELPAMKQINYLNDRLVNNENSIWNVYLASLYFEQDMLEDAKDICLDYLEKFPDDVFATIILAKTYLSQLQIKKAKEVLINAYQNNAENMVIVSLLGDIAVEGQDYEQAFEFYSAVLKVDPLSKVVENKLNDVKNELIQSESEAVGKGEDEGLRMLGLDREELHEIRNVFNELHLNRGSEGESSSDGQVSQSVAEIYIEQGEFEKAYKVYQGLLEKYPDNREIKGKINELTEKLKNKEA